MGHTLGDLIEGLFVVGGNGEYVAHIAEGDAFAQVNPHLEVVGGVEGGNAANALGTEAGAGAVGGAESWGTPTIATSYSPTWRTSSI
jgi:hypothetical protein